MTSSDHPTDAHDELPDEIARLLADEAMWEPIDPAFEDSIVAAVMDEAAAPAATAEAPPADDLPDNVVSLPSRWKSAALGAAAALLLVAGVFGITRIGGDESPDLEVVMAATDLAVGSSAVAEVTALDEGTFIKLTSVDLPPAEPGTYYEAWMRIDAETGVSAGTFHMRDGDGPIGLWTAVLAEDYPLLTVTIQQEAQEESSGRVVLRALLEP